MKKIFSICVVICLLFLTGCGGGLFTPREKIGNKLQSITADDSYQIIRGTEVVTPSGKYYKQNQGLLFYLDFETMQSMVVCSKPDCRHFSLQDDRNSTCNAILSEANYMFLYQDYLYYFNVTGDYGLQMELYKAEKDVSKRAKVAQYDFNAIGRLILKNGKLYIPAIKPKESETAEQLNSHNNTIGIHCIDMETFKDEKVYVEKEMKTGGYEPVGIYENQLIYSYSILDEEDKIDNSRLCTLNLDSGEEKVLFTGNMYAKLLDEQYFYYSLLDENILKLLDLETAETKMIADFSQNEFERIIDVSLLDHKVFYYTNIHSDNNPKQYCYYYDPKTGQFSKAKLIENFTEEDKTAYIFYEYKDRFIFSIFTVNGASEAYITKEDFYAGNNNYEIFREY